MCTKKVLQKDKVIYQRAALRKEAAQATDNPLPLKIKKFAKFYLTAKKFNFFVFFY